jgi:enoyl-CoA hydratase
MSDSVQLELSGGIATIILARPEKLNALDDGMIELLGRHADMIDADRSVRAVILTGDGKAFCAGGDIAACGGLSPLDMGQGWVRSGHRVFDKLARLKPPVIAAINGHALGGGLELAITADIRICEAQAKIGLPECGLGMIPGWSGTQRLVRRLGGSVARRLVRSRATAGIAFPIAFPIHSEPYCGGGGRWQARALRKNGTPSLPILSPVSWVLCLYRGPVFAQEREWSELGSAWVPSRFSPVFFWRDF